MIQARTDDERKRLNISITEADHERLKKMAAEAGINQGDAIHLLLELVDFAVKHERERVPSTPTTFSGQSASELETFALWVAWKAGIGREYDFNGALQVAASSQAITNTGRDSLNFIQGYFDIWGNKPTSNVGESETEAKRQEHENRGK